MANTLTNFLIGIGYDYDDKGEKQVKSGMESIKSSTLGIGAAMVSAAVGAGYAVDRTAEKSRKLQDQLYRTNTSTTWVQGYGASLKELGGNADDAVSRVVDAENMLSAIKMGDVGMLDSLSKAGFDAGYLAQSKDAQEFITRSAERFATVQSDSLISQSEYRRNMAAVLGLTDAEFKLWQQGGKYVDDHSKQLATQLGYTDSLNDKQYEYSQAWVSLNLELDKAGNTLSDIMLPNMTNMVGLANEFTSKMTSFAQENPDIAAATVTGGTVAAAGGFASTVAAVMAKLGLPGSRLIGAAGPVGMAAGASIAAEPWIDRGLNGMFGGSDYFQNIRTAPTWGDFGSALIGGIGSDDSHMGSDFVDWLSQPSPMRMNNDRHMRNINRHRRNLATEGDHYGPSMYRPDYNADMSGKATGAAITSVPQSPIQNNINMNATIELDGQKVGELMDNRINDDNLNSMQQFDSQVDR